MMRGSPRRGAGAGAASGPAGSLQSQGLAALRQGMRLQPSWKCTVLMQGGPCRPPGSSSPAFCPPPRSGGRFPRVFWQGAVQGGVAVALPLHPRCGEPSLAPAPERCVGGFGEFWGAVGNFGVLQGAVGAVGSCRELWGAAGCCGELWRAAGCTQHPGAHSSHVPSPFCTKSSRLRVLKHTGRPCHLAGSLPLNPGTCSRCWTWALSHSSPAPVRSPRAAAPARTATERPRWFLWGPRLALGVAEPQKLAWGCPGL